MMSPAARVIPRLRLRAGPKLSCRETDMRDSVRAIDASRLSVSSVLPSSSTSSSHSVQRCARTDAIARGSKAARFQVVRIMETNGFVLMFRTTILGEKEFKELRILGSGVGELRIEFL